MDDAHLVNISALTFKDPSDAEKHSKWGSAAYSPMAMSTGSVLAIEGHELVDKTGEYPESVPFMFFRNLEDYQTYMNSTEWAAYNKDIQATWGGKFEREWIAVYVLVKRFNNDQPGTVRNSEHTPQVAPILWLSGVNLSPEDWDRYNVWFNELGYPIYLPSLMRVPGIIEYSRWWLTNIRGWSGSTSTPKPEITENKKYPQDLSMIYFANFKAYQNFEISREYSAFRKALNAEFPNGLTYRWNVAYRVTSLWTRQGSVSY